MQSLIKPNSAQLERFLQSQQSLEYSYPAVGATRTGVFPDRFNVDRNRVLLGCGEAVFETACSLIRDWRMFPRDWTHVYPRGQEIEPGAVVAVVARVFGIWWLNASRIVYVDDDHGLTRRFGFAYGTLPGHVEAGEERFLVEWDQHDDQVWYEILSFSRPRHPLVRAAGPIARRLQAKFASDSLSQMANLVSQAASDPTSRFAEQLVSSQLI